MVLNLRASSFLKFLTIIVIGWGGLVFSSPADAHVSAPYVPDATAMDELSGAGESETAPARNHDEDRHCHGSGSVCHFHSVMYSKYSDWSLRGVGHLVGHVSVLRKGWEIIPPHRPPRYNRHFA